MIDAPRTTGAGAVTVLGNLAVDRVDGQPPTVGGAPAFVGAALAQAGGGRIVTRAAPEQAALIAQLQVEAGVPVTALPADQTSAFALQYDGDARTLTVEAIGPSWEPAEIQAAAVTTPWVHVAPLLRSDFSAAALRELAQGGAQLAFDGQGLVRRPVLGPLQTDAAYDPELLEHVAVLKLADDEARVLTGGRPFDAPSAPRLGVAEILLTAGSAGCTLWVGGAATHIPAAFAVEGVHATGAGDCFTVAYLSARASGAEPREAARHASQLVAELLLVRRELS